MLPFNKCPICGGEVVEKEVEKLIKGGYNTATITVKAEVCLHCGERLYSEETARRFEEIRNKLERKQTEEFEAVGRSYRVK
ncbi:MAG: YgiT-type zinc finger domain-containing protein [Spirochaetes bacterium]|nr:MAG: YgiT-type zinc finger domain-containing protein [Spirochaetota bacterium]